MKHGNGMEWEAKKVILVGYLEADYIYYLYRRKEGRVVDATQHMRWRVNSQVDPKGLWAIQGQSGYSTLGRLEVHSHYQATGIAGIYETMVPDRNVVQVGIHDTFKPPHLYDPLSVIEEMG